MEFWLGLCWIYRSVWQDCRLNHVDCFIPWTWCFSPFPKILFDLSQQCLCFSVWCSWMSFVRLIPKCFIWGFFCYCKFNVLFISCSNCALLLFKNTINFSLLTFYLAILWNSVISFKDCFTNSRRFFRWTVVSAENRDSFIPSFPVFMHFISFSCLMQRPGPLWEHGLEVVGAGILILFLLLGGKNSIFYH